MQGLPREIKKAKSVFTVSLNRVSRCLDLGVLELSEAGEKLRTSVFGVLATISNFESQADGRTSKNKKSGSGKKMI